nr:hypothetical protein [Tanacetum cinerariifolium]
MIDAIDADEDITLVNDVDNEMFNVDDLGGEEVFVVGQNKNVVEEVVNATQVSTAATIVTITTEEITLTQVLEALKFSKPKATLFQQLLEKRRKHFAAKREEEKRNKPPTKTQQRKIICTYLKNMEGYKLKDLKLKEFDSIQELFDKAFKRVNTFEDFRTDLVKGKEKRARIELVQESTKKQKVDDDKEKAELKQLMETITAEEVAIDAIPLAVKEDLEDLYKLVKAGYGSTRPVDNIDYLLLSDMKTMFELHVEDEIYMLVEKKYPLTPPTLSMMLETKL